MAAEDRDGELGRTLEAYARARLAADDATRARMRSRVMREAHHLARGGRVSPLAAVDERDPARVRGIVPPAGHSRRSRPFIAVLAAAFALLALTAAAVAAAPGGPLYAARLAVEEALLPSDAEARTNAEIRRLDARLSEVLQATDAGNSAALASALSAYHDIVDETLAKVGSSSEPAAWLEEAIGRHLAVLESLLATAPDQAQDALEHAIERSGRAAHKITGPPPRANPDQGGSPGQDGSGDKPAKSAKPDQTPRATRETPTGTPGGGPSSERPTPRGSGPNE